MPTEMSLLFQQQQAKIPNKVGYVGDLKYAPRDGDADFISNGWNTAKPTAQTTRITWPAPGVLGPNQKAYITITKPNGIEVVVTLRNDTAANIIADQAFNTAVVNQGGKTNNPLAGASPLSSAGSDLYGYTATFVGIGSSTDLSGPPGTKFTVTASGWGAPVLTNAPTITNTVTAVCAGNIYYGRAVVRNPLLFSQAVNGGYPNNVQTSIIAPEWDRIIALPSNAAGEVFAGIAIRSVTDVMPPGSDGCCDDQMLSGYYHCNDCVHYLNNADHNNQILVQLESPPAGVGVGVVPINQPVYYRLASGGVPGQTDLGTLSLFGVGGTALARDQGSNNYWVVKEVVDLARRLYYIGLLSDS
jgi:hypothetical protein